MIISIPKTKARHIHSKVKISDTTENDIAALSTVKLAQKRGKSRGNCKRIFECIF